MNEVLARLVSRLNDTLEERSKLERKRDAITTVAEQEKRDELSTEEDLEFRELTQKLAEVDEKIPQLQERIKEMEDEEGRNKRATEARRALGSLSERLTVNERRTYERGNGRSYFKDLIMRTEDSEAKTRLERHAQDVREAPEYRDLNRTDATGGFFVPPLWLVNDAVELARAGRPTANIVTRQDLPGGTDSINIPTIATGTATAVQTADNAAVQETDLVDASISAPVKTIAGQQDLAIQLLEQSPINFDELIFRDLTADLNTKLDVQVLSGSGASGQVTGIRTTSSVNAVTYTDATPTVGELYAKLADAVNQIHTNRFLSPTAIVMHPRRWAWFLAALDTQNRPLVVPNAQGPTNAVGTFGLAAEDAVGTIMGLPVIVDPSVPTNLGAGTNEDTIIVLRTTDSILWEGALRTRVLGDVGSATLTVRLQVYKYMAFTAARYPKSISLITGTGLVAPTF